MADGCPLNGVILRAVAGSTPADQAMREGENASSDNPAAMTPEPIVPAEVDFSDPLSPRSPRFDDRYHGAHGAFEQAAHVFLGGNNLPARWHGRAAFSILETGYGLGNNVLATCAAWTADPHRCARRRFV